MLSRLAPLCLGFLIATGCSATRLQTVWRAPEAFPAPRKALVIGYTPHETTRRQLEASFVEELGKLGLAAVPSSRFVPSGRDLDRVRTEALVKQEGADVVLVAQVTDVRDQSRFVPGSAGFNPMWGSFWGYHGYAFNRSYARGGFVEQSTQIEIETLLYRADGEGALVWSTVSTTLDPRSPEAASRSVSKAVVKRMRKDGVL